MKNNRKNESYVKLEKGDPVYAWLEKIRDVAWNHRRDSRMDHVMYAPRSFYTGCVASMACGAMDKLAKGQMKEEDYNALVGKTHEIFRWANSRSQMGAPNGIDLLDRDGNVQIPSRYDY